MTNSTDGVREILIRARKGVKKSLNYADLLNVCALDSQVGRARKRAVLLTNSPDTAASGQPQDRSTSLLLSVFSYLTESLFQSKFWHREQSWLPQA